ncbi:MAG: hypothetical protein M3O15_03260 [Acidobacteriota bacterium]|nr:hypothetical protein [Acidobacteriota bacterium]
MTEKSLEASVAAAGDGDGAALDALLRQHQPRIYRFGLRMCRDAEDAKDVLQETLFAAARSLSGLHGASLLTTWLYSIKSAFTNACPMMAILRKVGCPRGRGR